MGVESTSGSLGVSTTSVPDYQAPKGMRDVLAPESGRWAAVVATFAEHARRAGFGLVLTPIIEHVEVFERVGDSTDIVRKEMYDFDRQGWPAHGGAPEITAGLMRAFAEHRPPTPWKAWTVGPNFRYEQPQAGRYRQHHQLDAEIVGTADPDADVEVIALLDGFHRALGLQRRTLLAQLARRPGRPARPTSTRCAPTSRPTPPTSPSRAARRWRSTRCACSTRSGPRTQPVIAGAPLMLDYLSPASAAHFERVRAGLERARYRRTCSTPRLVRGLDYYNRTTFEIAVRRPRRRRRTPSAGAVATTASSSSSVGPPARRASGFGAGVERILLACDAEGVFAAHGRHRRRVRGRHRRRARRARAHRRAAGAPASRADRAFDGRSMKAQMKAADRSGAAVALIVGADEAAAGEVTVRPLRGERGEQVRVPRDKVVDYVKERR